MFHTYHTYTPTLPTYHTYHTHMPYTSYIAHTSNIYTYIIHTHHNPGRTRTLQFLNHLFASWRQGSKFKDSRMREREREQVRERERERDLRRQILYFLEHENWSSQMFMSSRYRHSLQPNLEMALSLSLFKSKHPSNSIGSAHKIPKLRLERT